MVGGREEGFTEVADRCFVARYAAWDTTIGAVLGDGGLLVVDTRATAGHGTQIRDDLRRVAPGVPVQWVVNTHQHFDHVLGNSAFEGAVVHAHEAAAAAMADDVAWIRAEIGRDPEPALDVAITDEVIAGVLESPLRLPDRTFSSVATIDLGDRYVELVHPGRGHTDGDVLLRVPDCDVVFAGDQVEQSAPPSYGMDCYPLDWPGSLDILMGMLTGLSVVVPGHGAVVDRDFVGVQRQEVSDVAELIRSLYTQGVAEADALAAGGSDWPYPREHLARGAVPRGYLQLAQAGAEPGSSPASSTGLPTLPLA